jgi:hypothetical protein
MYIISHAGKALTQVVRAGADMYPRNSLSIHRLARNVTGDGMNVATLSVALGGDGQVALTRADGAVLLA